MALLTDDKIDDQIRQVTALLSPASAGLTVPELPDETRAARLSDDHIAEELRGFGPLGILSIVVILAGNLVLAPLSAILVLLWARLSHTAWRAIGYVRPESWTRAVVIGITFGVAFKIVTKVLVMPLLGAPPLNQAYHYLVGNTAALPGVVLAMIVVAGWGEETVFRGYMFERLGRLIGTATWARFLTIVLTSGLFAMGHYHVQGLAGVEQAMITGLVFGTIFAVTGRLWMLMFAHAAYDLTAVALIYWNLESQFAHLVFK
ncbi:MAG TPA: type II CAAX endopeptidase family protein [Gemmatimonadaceae bacterium]